MPTNLPQDYYDVEERYRAATTPEEKAALLEEMLSTIPKHKGTDHLRADLRRKLAQLKAASQAGKGASRQASAFHVAREGAGQVVIVGCTNVGKSVLVAALTHATPLVAESPYSTWAPTPGMMAVDNIQVQLVDTPPLNPDFVEPELFNLIRRADLIVVMVDLQDDAIQEFEDTVAMLEAHHILPTHRRAMVVEPRRHTFRPMLVVANKADNEQWDADAAVLCELVCRDWPLVAISVTHSRSIERFKQAVYDQLGIMRIYAKPPGKEPDYSAPFVMKKGGMVEEFAAKVHKDFVEHLKSARVWGQGVYDGQLVGRDHVLHDGDVVELRA
jgi:hypothetical protein